MLLKFAIQQEFKDDREYKNLSTKTIESYLLTLNEFQDYAAKQEVLNAEDVTSSLIKSYLIYCQKERNNNPTTRNSKLHTLKIFFNFLESEEYITAKQNPTKKIGYVKEEIKIEVFTDAQINQMLTYLRRLKQREHSYAAYRNYVIIVILLGAGLRLGELCNLKWEDINFKHRTLTVWGKKREQSSVPITEKLVKELAEYKVFCEQHFNELSEYVFVNQYANTRLTEYAVKSMFQRLKKIMNFSSSRLSCHSFRHTYCHRLLMAGCDTLTLQKLLRHTQLSMTQRYVALWGNELKSQNDKYNPLNEIDI